MKQCSEQFCKWYDEREGTKSESFAYDVWCAAWEAAMWEATKPEKCVCENITKCTMFDKCMKGVA